jgi:hypothetical protein
MVRGFEQGDFERGDFEAASFEWLDPEIDWRGPRGVSRPGRVALGHEGVRDYILVLSSS